MQLILLAPLWGVLAAVHVGLPILGLKGLILFAALLDIGLGLFLLSKESVERIRSIDLSFGALVGLGALALTIAMANLDPKLLSSGVYRIGAVNLDGDDEVVFYQDGKTASVALRATEDGKLVLMTNGKPDASIQMDRSMPRGIDEITQVLLGTLPLAYMPDAKRVAVIGMGSGATTHAMLANVGIEKADTIEIEPAMVIASSGFGDFVERTHKDPRSEIHIEDAKTFFSLHNSTYDIIVAEPSNPWVSGVSSLFSTEFYRTIKGHLEDDGVFVQWIQLYEFNDDLLESILKALTENFSDYVIYIAGDVDILLVARHKGELPKPEWSALFSSGMAEELASQGVNSESDMVFRKLIKRNFLVSYLESSRAPANSDYFPFVDLNAGQARYKGSLAHGFEAWMISPLPMVEMLAGDQLKHHELSPNSFFARARVHQNAIWIYRRLAEKASLDELGGVAENMGPEMTYVADTLRNEMRACASDQELERFRLAAHDVMVATLPFLDVAQGVSLVDALAGSECATQQAAPTPFWFDLYRAVARRDAKAMSFTARRLLQDDAGSPAILQGYLVMAAMLGDIVAGRPADAREIWNLHSGTAFQNGRLSGDVELLSRIALNSVPIASDRADAYSL